jgi:FecR protein.
MFKSFRFALLMAGALFALGAVAQPARTSNPAISLIRHRASRAWPISAAQVSFVPAGENDWVEAQINRPLITGDKLWTDHDSRAELEIGSSALRLDAQTSFDFLNLDDQTAQIELTEGSLNLRVRRLYDNQVYEIDTPTLAFVINRVGEYRLTVLPNGQSTVVNVLQGGGDAYGENGARSRIEEGQSVTFNDSGLRDYYTDSLPPPDSFDEFCRQRDGRSGPRQVARLRVRGRDRLSGPRRQRRLERRARVRSRLVPDDRRGRLVALSQRPLGLGRRVGWTWIDDAPWGFAPFHYGRWAYIGNRWGWCPGAIGVRPYYAPALVAFIGGGVSVGVAVGGPVGWFPLGPRDVYFPGYHVSQRYFTNVNVTNTVVNTTVINNYYGNYSRGDVNYTQINYANRNINGAVTAVPATAFASARPVAARRLR